MMQSGCTSGLNAQTVGHNSEHLDAKQQQEPKHTETEHTFIEEFFPDYTIVSKAKD